MSSVAAVSRSTDVVTVVVKVNGSELPGTVALLAAVVGAQTNRIPYARLRIADGDPAGGDFPQSSGALFVPGNTVEILAGYHGETQTVFSGMVLRQHVVVRRGGSWLEVECRDPAFKMTLTRHNRYFEDQSDSDVAQALLAEYPDLVADITATSVVHPQLLQYQATDWDFMLSRLEVNGQVCIVAGGKVSSVAPTLAGDATVDVGYGVSLIELDAEFDARTQSGTVRAIAWDPAGQALQEAGAADPGWAGNGNLTSDDMTSATGRQEDLLWHGGSVAADALQAWADAALLRARLAAARGRVRFQGIADVKPGGVLQISKLGERFDGKVYVTGVRHEFSNNDWLTDAEFGLPRQSHAEAFAISHVPAAGLVPSVAGLQAGVVTQLADDPGGEHRIRVKVPLAGMDEQGVWARVATLDAGAQRGTFFRPEVDDEVVLGFFHDDPGQPVVLGMLHSSANAPPLTASEDNDQKTYVSRSGIALLFDDKKKVVTLKTPAGNALTLSDDDGGITLADQNGNKITLDSNGIVLTSAKDLSLKAKGDFKAEGVNSDLKASAAFKAQGSASTEISSSGTLTVKGAMVQIN